jgi:hypothetical protein
MFIFLPELFFSPHRSNLAVCQIILTIVTPAAKLKK